MYALVSKTPSVDWGIFRVFIYNQTEILQLQAFSYHLMMSAENWSAAFLLTFNEQKAGNNERTDDKFPLCLHFHDRHDEFVVFMFCTLQ